VETKKARTSNKKSASTKRPVSRNTSAQKSNIDVTSILNTFKDSIFSIDRNYRYTSFNSTHAENMKAIFHVDIQIGKSVLTYIPDTENRQRAKKRFDSVLQGNEAIGEEIPIGDQNTKLRYVKNSNRPIYDSQGKVTGALVLSEDITESKLLKELLEENEKKFQSFMDYNPWGTFIVAQEKRKYKLLYVNSAFSHILDYEPEEIIERPLTEFIHPDDMKITLKELQSRFAGLPPTKPFSLRAYTKEKSIINCEIYGILSNHQGKPAVVGMLVNTTA